MAKVVRGTKLFDLHLYEAAGGLQGEGGGGLLHGHQAGLQDCRGHADRVMAREQRVDLVLGVVGDPRVGVEREKG